MIGSNRSPVILSRKGGKLSNVGIEFGSDGGKKGGTGVGDVAGEDGEVGKDRDENGVQVLVLFRSGIAGLQLKGIAIDGECLTLSLIPILGIQLVQVRCTEFVIDNGRDGGRLDLGEHGQE